MEKEAAETNVEEFDEETGVAVPEEAGEEQQGTETEPATSQAKAEEKGVTGEKEAEHAEPQKPWKTEANAKAAAERRERERKEAEDRAYRKGIVDSVGGINPYTNEKIEDEADIREFLAMREIERSGGDPLQDYAAHVKKQAKEQAKTEAAAAAANEKAQWIQEDFNAFANAHPELDAEKLMADKAFAAFAEGKIGTWPLEKIYAGYAEVFGNFEEKAQQKANRLFAKAKASPGSLSGGEAQTLSYAEMSDDEFERTIARAKRGELTKK